MSGRRNLWKGRLACFPNGALTRLEAHGEVTLVVGREHRRTRVRRLRDGTGFQFKVLVDRTAVDYPSREPRFDLVYQRLSLRYQTRCRIKVRLDELTPV